MSGGSESYRSLYFRVLFLLTSQVMGCELDGVDWDINAGS